MYQCAGRLVWTRWWRYGTSRRNSRDTHPCGYCCHVVGQGPELLSPTPQRLQVQVDGLSLIVQLAETALPADHGLADNALPRAGHPVSYCADLRPSLSRPSSGFFGVAAIPAARSFAIRPMSFTGTGLVSGKWTVPFRSS